MKKFDHQEADLSFTYPDDWEIEQEKNIVSVYNPINGVGALQFSFYQIGNDQAISLKDELEDYVKGRHENGQVKLDGSYSFSNFLEGKDGRFWRYWLFIKGKTLTFVSYNCYKNDIGVEEKKVNDIVLSATQRD